VLEARYPLVGLKAAKPAPERAAALRRKSQELKLCTEDIALSLEDDAPIAGPRAAFLVDVQNPCWIYTQAPLDNARTVVAHVGQVPFNFQIGEAVKKIKFPKPTTPEGELEVRLDSCEGEVIARLPLAPALASQAVTRLPPVPIAARAGRHDLCLRFAQHTLDPIWVIDSFRIEVAP
jgi:hexosaminidase